MPCYDTGSREGDLALAAREAQVKVTKLTRLLCEANKVLDGSYLTNSRSREMRERWEEHKRLDKEREERERRLQNERDLRRKALSKLSPEERRALGHR